MTQGKNIWLVALALLSLAACRRGLEQDSAHKTQLPVVEVVHVIAGDIDREVTGTAVVSSEQKVQIIAETSGRISALPVEAGQVVQKGQLLCQISNPRLFIALDRARLEVEQMQSQLKSTTRLNERGFVSRKTREDLEFGLRRVELEARRAEEEVRLLRVLAPFDGVLVRRDASLGEVVGPQRSLFTLVDDKNLRIDLALPESQSAGLQLDVEARVRSVANKTQAIANVKRISPVVDERTGTRTITLGLGADQGLVPGTLVSVTMTVERHQGVLLVPRRALDMDKDPISLYRLETNPHASVDAGTSFIARRVEPQVGLLGSTQVEIVSGLSLGDKIVTAGQSALRDGAVVRVLGQESDDEREGQATDSGLVKAQDETAVPSPVKPGERAAPVDAGAPAQAKAQASEKAP